MFHVPPPVLSDWYEYLRSQLTAALPDHSDEDFHAVYRIFDLKGVASDRSPTPRDIKLFVNRVGAIHRRWGDEIPLPLQALYAVIAQRGWRAETELEKDEQELLKPVPIQLVGAQWREAIAAIYFGCEREKALQFLWGHRINSALTGGTVDDLQPLRKMHGFTQVCEQVIEEKAARWAQEESRTIGIAAGTLSQLDVNEDKSWERLWKLLYDSASTVVTWNDLDRDVGVGIARLFQRSPSAEFARSIIAALSSSSPLHGGKEGPDAAVVSRWVEGVAAILKAVQTQFPDLVQEFRVAGDAKAWLAVASALTTNVEQRDLCPLFRPVVGPGDVVAELSARVSDGRFDRGSAGAVTTMLLLDLSWDWQPLVSQLRARLETQNATPQEIGHHLSALFRMAPSDDNARTTLQIFARSGHAFHYLQAVRGAGQHRSAALCLATVIAEIPAGAAQQMPGNAGAGQAFYQEVAQKPDAHPDVVREFAECAADFEFIDSLWEAPAKAKIIGAFVRAVFEDIAQRDNAHEIITPEGIIARYGLLGEVLETVTLRGLISRSVEKTSLQRDLISRGFDPDLGGLYLDVLRVLKDPADYVAFLVHGLREIQQAAWLTELQQEGCLTEIVLDLVDKGQSPGLTTGFQDALLAHAQGLITGKSKIEHLQDRWGRILGALTDSARAAFFRRTIDELCDATKAADRFLEAYGAALAASDAVEIDADDLVLKGFKNFLQRRSARELQWIEEVLEKHPKLLERVNSSTRDDFRERIRTVADEPELAEDVKAAVLAIAARSGVELGTRDTDDASDDPSSDSEENS
jgi:hypothetical protein